MSPLERQQKILQDCAVENAAAHKKYDELVKAGHKPVMQGQIVGPYTTRTSYYMSEGSFITLVTPSSLRWAFDQVII